MYSKIIKRGFDIVCALAAMVVFFWLYGIVAFLVRIKLGAPILFVQQRPGRIDPKTGTEKIFRLYKFRTMTDERDEQGMLLPDDERLTQFGRFLRSTSLDELPEVWNILKGDMSVVGPRPQLIRDMVFMSEEQRRRHNVRPGLSGLAQVRGRNSMSWEGKLETDLEYIAKISLWRDITIIFQTVVKVIRREGISMEGMDTAEDYGDYLLRVGMINREEYFEKQVNAEALGLVPVEKKEKVTV